MQDDFDKLAAQLDAVEGWLDVIEQGPLRPAERKLADSLREYVEHCRRDDRKWRSVAAATRAINKINRIWFELQRTVFPRWNR